MDLLKCPLPKGWTVQLNSDGSYGIHGPTPERSATPVRTSHALYPSDRSDLGELVRRMCQDALSQSVTAKPLTQAEIKLMAEMLISMPELRRVSKSARQTGWHSPGLGEVHKDDTDHVIFEVDWAEHEVPLEDSVGDGKQEDADHAAAFNPIVAGQLLDTLGILFRLLSAHKPELMLQITSLVYTKLGQPSDKEDPCAPTL